jgi:multisubunit Na+/H+ antiporter MnhE subunit
LIITLVDIPEKSVRFVDVILGFIMGTVVSTMLNFFFGSSQSSKDKTKELMKK